MQGTLTTGPSKGDDMPLFGKSADTGGSSWEPEAAEAGWPYLRRGPGRSVHFRPVRLGVRAARGGGFRAFGFVVGSSIYHIGLQIGKWSENQELQVLTQAMYNARELAMTRMQAEAEHLGADGTVGVQLRMQAYVWGQDVLEFIATGTAVKATGSSSGAHRAPDGRAFTSDLSVQDFFRLLAAGAVPVAFVLGTCVYHIAHQSAFQALRQTGQNQEMTTFTQGIYEARELASPGCSRGCRGASLRHSWCHRWGLQPRLGRARHRVPRHRYGDPPARRRAPARGHLPEADVHSRTGPLSAIAAHCRCRALFSVIPVIVTLAISLGLTAPVGP